MHVSRILSIERRVGNECSCERITSLRNSELAVHAGRAGTAAPTRGRAPDAARTGDHQVDDDRFSLTATHGHGETELATRDVELGLATTLGNTAAASLDAIDAALARLDTVDFGMCDTCGRPIPVERLLAVPEASRCVRCQQHHRERR